MTPNPVRGEVKASIGSLELVLVADMDGLARLSGATGHPTLAELYARLHGTELQTVMLAIELFTTGGTLEGKKLGKDEAVTQARARITLDDVLALQGPLSGLLAALLSKRKDGAPRGNAASGRNP